MLVLLVFTKTPEKVLEHALDCLGPLQMVMSWHLIISKKDWRTDRDQGLLLSVPVG